MPACAPHGPGVIAVGVVVGVLARVPGAVLRMLPTIMLLTIMLLPALSAQASGGGAPEGGTAQPVEVARIDPEHTRIGFTLKTRWGQVLRGRFPAYTGSVERLADGRRRVQLRLDAREVVIDGHPNYTRYTRGEGFFDADRFAEMSFVSDPYSPALLRGGGTLSGTLQIRNVQRTERFQITPSACSMPGEGCDVVAVGSVRRSDYGVDRWMFAVSDQVRFTLRLRLRPVGDEAAP